MSRKLEVMPILFQDSGGQPMRFYLRPGPMKMELYPLITNGGGVLCRNQEPGSILLIDPSDVSITMANSGQKYFSTKYIRDCVEQNLQLDIDEYVITIGNSIMTRMASRHLSIGRMSYSLDDDEAIMRFIKKRLQEAKGNQLWKEMQKRHVTDHTWQSMKDRFLKHLQQKLIERSKKKNPSKRKTLDFKESPVRKKKVLEIEDSRKSPQRCMVEPETQIDTDVWVDAPSSPERASSPPEEPTSEPPRNCDRESLQSFNCYRQDDVHREEQETLFNMSNSPRVETDPKGQDIREEANKHSSPPKKRHITSRKASRKKRIDPNLDEPDFVEESNKHSSPNKTRQTHPRTASQNSRVHPNSDSEDFSEESDTHSSPNKARRITTRTASTNSRVDQDSDGPDFAEGSLSSTRSRKSPNKTRHLTADEESSEQDSPDGSSAQTSKKKTRPTEPDTSSPDSTRLGLLTRAAREFESSDAADESDEGENSLVAPSVILLDTHESSASTRLSQQPEIHSEPPEQAQNQSPAPEEEEAGPSSSSDPPESVDQHCSQVRETPEETLLLLDAKKHIQSLMMETRRGLVEVMKALLMSSGNLRKARVFLQEGEVQGPLWSILDDQNLRLGDPDCLQQLQLKFGEQEVDRRRGFLTADDCN